MRRVFISSAIDGFETERQAAKAVVESLGLEAVMAEDFGAGPSSPQTACLQGVQSCDIYLGMLGPRYGSLANSGLSPTEEEYQAAREGDLQILWFVMNCKRDERQEALYMRMTDYEEGYFVDFFSSPTELVTKITKSLHRMTAEGGENRLDATGAGKLAARHISRAGSESHPDPVLGVVMLPRDQSDTYLSVVDLGRSETAVKLLQPALFGATAVLNPEFGTKTVVGREHLALIQRDQDDRCYCSLEFHPGGHLIWLSRIRSEYDGVFSVLRSHVIDEDVVRERLVTFFTYADLFYSKLANSPRVSAFFATVFMLETENKKLGRISGRRENSVSIGFSSMEAPLVVPRLPMQVSRSQLKGSRDLAENLLDLVRRAFKAEGQYYSQ